MLVGIVMFAIIRLQNPPAKKGRYSRFFGSHLSGAWIVLGMIFLVVLTLLMYRGAKVGAALAAGETPADVGMSGAFASQGIGHVLEPLGVTANHWIESLFVLGHVPGHPELPADRAALASTCTSSWHRSTSAPPAGPDGLGPLLPMYAGTETIDFEDPADDAMFGRGQIEDFTWKGLLDFATCTECGRCQSPVPCVEHRQAAVAEADDHEPARPLVRQGAVRHGGAGEARQGRSNSARSTRTSWPR